MSTVREIIAGDVELQVPKNKFLSYSLTPEKRL